MILKGFAILFAIVFIALGLGGSIACLMQKQLLFNLFTVNSILYLFHILVGLIILSASVSTIYTKLCFQIVGIVFALITILSFALNGNFGFLKLNLVDSMFNAIVTIIALYLGFTIRGTTNERLPLS